MRHPKVTDRRRKGEIRTKKQQRKEKIQLLPGRNAACLIVNLSFGLISRIVSKTDYFYLHMPDRDGGLRRTRLTVIMIKSTGACGESPVSGSDIRL